MSKYGHYLLLKMSYFRITEMAVRFKGLTYSEEGHISHTKQSFLLWTSTIYL